MKRIISVLTAVAAACAALTASAAEEDAPPTLTIGAVEINDSWTLTGGARIENGKIYLPAGSESGAYIDFAVPSDGAGFYRVTADISARSCDGSAYLYTENDGETLSKTSVMKSLDGAKTLTVKTPRVSRRLRIGVYSDGTKEIYADAFNCGETGETSEFLQGGDISALYYVISNGGIYKDEDGTPLFNDSDDIEAKVRGTVNYLASRGMNFARVRLTNNPGEDGELRNPDNPADASRYHLPAGFEDEDDCLKLAKYADEAGMKVQFTFNLSDYWSNAEQQYIPADWRKRIEGKSYDESIEILTECVSGYVTDIMTKLAAEGVYPAYVSLGNETAGGFLFPYGYSYQVSESSDKMPAGKENWAAITSFTNAGYDAVKAVSPESRVVIHLNDWTGDYAYHPEARDRGVFWWFNDYKNAGGKWDVTGISYYPSWSEEPVDSCAALCDALYEYYEKPVLIMESGYEWYPTRWDGYKGQLQYNTEEYKTLFPVTEEEGKSSQKGFVSELIARLKATDSAVGSLYWDPMYIHVEKDGKNATGWAHYYDENGNDVPDVNVIDNTTLFDFDGKALPAFEAYEDNVYAEPLDTGIYVYAGYDRESGVLTDVKLCRNGEEFDINQMSGLRVKRLHWKDLDGIKPIGAEWLN